MPSPLAHGAVAFALYQAAARRQSLAPSLPLRLGLAAFALFVSLAADFDFFPGWFAGRLIDYHNQASHSLVAAGLFAVAVGTLAMTFGRVQLRDVAAFALVGYLLHLGLDALTWGRGVPLFWPFSEFRVKTPWTPFRGLRWDHGLWSVEHVKTALNELPFVLAVVGLTVWRGRRGAVIRQPSAVSSL